MQAEGHLFEEENLLSGDVGGDKGFKSLEKPRRMVLVHLGALNAAVCRKRVGIKIGDSKKKTCTSIRYHSEQE